MEEYDVDTDDLVIITGDIIDQADYLSPECIQLTKYFFINLSMYCNVCFILGNHEQPLYDKKQN